MANILVFIEKDEDAPTAASLEVLAEARRIASCVGATLHALLPCETPPTYGSEDLVAVLSRYGADKVVLITGCPDGPAHFATHGPALLAACDRFPPLLVLFPEPAGHDLAPRTAFHLRALYAPGAQLGDASEPGTFEQPVFRRRFRWCEAVTAQRPLVLTIRQGPAASPPAGDDEAEVVVLQAPKDPGWSFSPVAPQPPAARRHRLVVGGGAGLGDAAGFALLRDFADAVGAPWVATRTACERGFAETSAMAALDGLPVDADAYLAFGVSGSDDHMIAVSPHTEVIAVNTDRGAPIFRFARYGLVADAAQTLDELTKRARRPAPEGERCA